MLGEVASWDGYFLQCRVNHDELFFYVVLQLIQLIQGDMPFLRKFPFSALL